MNVRSIRADLAAALAGQGYRVYDTVPPGQVELPLAVVMWPDEIRFHQSLSDSVELEIVVSVAVSLNDWSEAQKDIDEAMSTPGLGSVIESYSSTAWHSIICETAGSVRQVKVGAAEALAADFTFTVYAS